VKKCPSRTKFRKMQKLNCGEIRGEVYDYLDRGDFGLKSLENGRITDKQIEAVRVTITRSLKDSGCRAFRLFWDIFPHKVITKKPLETRMGGGKGSPEEWVSIVKCGKLILEVVGAPKPAVVEAFRLASYKLPVKTTLMERIF
jgi:large subunit ribosomal protein L16